MPKERTVITQRAYGRHRGVSHTAVAKAIATGRLARSVVRRPNGEVSGIDPELADKEWDLNTDPSPQRERPETPRERPAVQVEDHPDPEQPVLFPGADLPKEEPAPAKGGSSQLPLARTMLVAAQAKMAAIDLAERQDKLADVRELQDAATQAWATLRDDLLQWVDTIPDQIATYRGDAVKIRKFLREGMRERLTRLASVIGNGAS